MEVDLFVGFVGFTKLFSEALCERFEFEVERTALNDVLHQHIDNDFVV